jgi:endonuclease-3 related protein
LVRTRRLQRIREFYHLLYRTWGPQNWWPAQSRFEVIVGAYLTQNTAWTNVERALRQLRLAGVLCVEGIRRAPLRELEELIRSAGYFRQKAQRLKTFVEFLDSKYGGSLDRMFAQPTDVLREQLLSLHGVGPETADSILLYAGNHPSFVVDAYTRRILERHCLVAPKTTYDEIRKLFEAALRDKALLTRYHTEAEDFASGRLLRSGKPEGSCHGPSHASTMHRTDLAQVFNEMHGLIVGVGKNYCSNRDPKCNSCPLGPLLPKRSVSTLSAMKPTAERRRCPIARDVGGGQTLPKQLNSRQGRRGSGF